VISAVFPVSWPAIACSSSTSPPAPDRRRIR
jgi:hypothetical protein